jgi:hypothetical protein
MVYGSRLCPSGHFCHELGTSDFRFQNLWTGILLNRREHRDRTCITVRQPIVLETDQPSYAKLLRMEERLL